MVDPRDAEQGRLDAVLDAHLKEEVGDEEGPGSREGSSHDVEDRGRRREGVEQGRKGGRADREDDEEVDDDEFPACEEVEQVRGRSRT